MSSRRAWGAALAVTLAVVTAVGLWLPGMARALVCAGGDAPSDAIIVENFDLDFRLFEGAATLQRQGSSARVLIPTAAAGDDSRVANPVDREIAALMARMARIEDPEIVPVHATEPYALSAAYDIRAFLMRERVGSVLVLSPALRSRRSLLVYRHVLAPAGIRVHCQAVFGQHTPENWTSTWHGIQVVTEQFVKLQYYRFWVLRADGPYPGASGG